MSLKITKLEKKKPRAMPIETIVTRFKSKQKLLEKEQQNVTNNVKKQNPIKKPVLNPRKSIKQLKKIDVAEKNEIYPNKVRRKIVNKKIVLVPKHSYKVIGRIKGCNKRKLKVPQKEISFLRQTLTSNSSNELHNKQTDISIIDMVKMIEDSRSLDDEDLLEILTCPSPVWWEDPPDGYIEEAIFSKAQPKFEQKSVKTQLLEEQKREEQKKIGKKAEEDMTIQKFEIKVHSMEINVENRDTTFMKKRSKLEILLGNILNSKESKEVKTSRSKNFVDSETLETNPAITKPNSVEPSTKLKKYIQKSHNKKRKLKSNLINKKKLKRKNLKSNKKSNLVQKSKKKRKSDCFKLSDIEDDILEHLENMEIPIEDNTMKLNLKKEDEIEGKDEKEVKTEERKEDEIEQDEKEDEIEEKEQREVKKEDEIEEKEQREVKKEETDRRLSTESNKSDRNLSDDAEYLDMSVFDEVLENKTVDFNEVEFNEVSNSNENTEYVTVYKIINNEINNDINELKIILPIEQRNDKLKENSGKINDYYKQCKKIKLHKAESLPKVSKKSILISESELVRYCLLCSSIFDKETCDYCEKKNLKRKNIVYVCDFCGFKVNNKHDLVEHLVIHK